MASRYVTCRNLEHAEQLEEAGILLFCMGTTEESDDPSTYKLVRSDWTAYDLTDEYTTEETWRRNEWRIQLED